MEFFKIIILKLFIELFKFLNFFFYIYNTRRYKSEFLGYGRGEDLFLLISYFSHNGASLSNVILIPDAKRPPWQRFLIFVKVMKGKYRLYSYTRISLKTCGAEYGSGYFWIGLAVWVRIQLVEMLWLRWMGMWNRLHCTRISTVKRKDVQIRTSEDVRRNRYYKIAISFMA